VVDAAVASFTSSPVSQNDIRSGIIAIRAADSRPDPHSSESSWKTVLIGIVWIPVTEYRSLRETRSCARAIAPSVRASR
jgi:hypothetical protein